MIIFIYQHLIADGIKDQKRTGMISDDDRVSRAAFDHEHRQTEIFLISTAQSKSKN